MAAHGWARAGCRTTHPGSPEQDDQAAQPYPVAVITGGAHHGNDFLDRRRIRWMLTTLVAGRSAVVAAGQGRS
jgi:hypothetical protein